MAAREAAITRLGPAKVLDRRQDLYVGRAIDPATFNRIETVQEAAEKYSAQQDRRSGTQLSFALLLTAISLIGLLSTLWIGLRATRSIAASAPRLS